MKKHLWEVKFKIVISNGQSRGEVVVENFILTKTDDVKDVDGELRKVRHWDKRGSVEYKSVIKAEYVGVVLNDPIDL